MANEWRHVWEFDDSLLESIIEKILTALRREGKEGLTSNAIRVQALAAHKNYPCGPHNGEQ
jgi:hypothetical protein